MATVCFLAFAAGLFLLQTCGLAAEIREGNTGGLFVSQQSAHAVLRRLRRYNSGVFEELKVGNLERECREEQCSYEEAREVFEHEEKTLEFWAGYIDGDQCDPPPCQNGGECHDGVSSYVCWCKPNFSGKNCEIELSKQCTLDNGGCSHFCVTQERRVVCQCAAGYTLGPDMRSCLPKASELFSCGQVSGSSGSGTRSLITPRSSSRTHASRTKHNSTHDFHGDNYDYNTTDLYDEYYDHVANYSDFPEVSVASAVRSVRSVQTEVGSDGGVPEQREPSFAYFPTIATIKEKENTDQRIVGGNEVTPGQIPWQVALMSYSTSLQLDESFCGGSLLSELWVVTAAHCMMTETVRTGNYFVRVGEHDVLRHEGPERDHKVEEYFLPKMYNYTKSHYNHDIALLKLTEPVELSDRRRPICLGPKIFIENILKESSGSLVSGWGRLLSNGLQATKLQKVEVPYVDRTLCKQSTTDHITRFMFCAGYLVKAKDSCQGDSGGPHATNYKGTWFLTGIVSWGDGCAKEGRFGIYTQVSSYYRWISKTTGIHIEK